MEKSIKYLGCGLPSRLDNAFHLNYGPPIWNIKGDLHGWEHITVFWTGRINTLKMNVLPRISYLFHQLPVDVPDKQFKDKDVKDACVIFCAEVHPCRERLQMRPLRMVFLKVLAIWNKRVHLILGEWEGKPIRRCS